MNRNPITIRRLSLRFPQACDPVIANGKPEESFLYIGLSLLLPHLEPYLIRSMVAAKPRMRDDALIRDTEAFIGQESQHYRMHIQFNRCLDLQRFVGLKELEAQLAADYQRFSEKASLRFNLAYAEGFEAFTMALSRFVFQSGILDSINPEVRDLLLWHLVEELEHRTVAFDVYQTLYGSYLYRLGVGLFAQWHLCQFVFGVSRLMLRLDRKRFGGRWRSFQRVGSLLWLAWLYFLPKLLNTYMPWYSPHHIEMPASAQVIADQFTERARSGAKPS